MPPVLPTCLDAATLFLACATQWRQGPDGRPEGLDYAGCRAAAKGLGIGWRRAFEGLRTMESAALAALEALSGPPEGGG